MAQLRQHADAFAQRDTAVLILGPEKAEAFRAYWRQEQMPFVGLPDPQHTALKLYGQEVNLFRLGRMPAQVLVDKKGLARYAHYGHALSDIPPAEEMLALLDEINHA